MMPLDDSGDVSDLIHYRIETAKTDLSSAKLLREAGDYKGANNRAYYSVFHAIGAVHGLNKTAYKRHKDAIGSFNRDYVKTEVFSRDIGRKISGLEEIRHASDYDDFYVVSIDEVNEAVEVAEEFIILVEEYCKNKLNKGK